MSNEERLNRIEKALNDEVRQSAEFRGELRNFMENTGKFIADANKTAQEARKELEEHKSDQNAHGAGYKRDWNGNMALIVSGFSGGLLEALIHMFLVK